MPPTRDIIRYLIYALWFWKRECRIFAQNPGGALISIIISIIIIVRTIISKPTASIRIAVGGSFAARWARMVLKRCSSERGEREKRFYGGGKGERRRTAF